jgi:hypothetical protein
MAVEQWTRNWRRVFAGKAISPERIDFIVQQSQPLFA